MGERSAKLSLTRSTCRVRPTSPESFIVNLYRRDNKVALCLPYPALRTSSALTLRPPQIGFLKAFSDRPEAFTFGISPLQTTLVQLKLREVIILPRYVLEAASQQSNRQH